MLYSDEYVRQRWQEITDPAERNAFALQVMGSWHDHINSRFEKEHPDWSVGDKAAEAFIRKYGDEFMPEELQRIIRVIRYTYNENNVNCQQRE